MAALATTYVNPSHLRVKCLESPDLIVCLQSGGGDVGLGAARVVALVLAVRVGAVDGLDVVLQAGEALQGEAALVARRGVLGGRRRGRPGGLVSL